MSLCARGSPGLSPRYEEPNNAPQVTFETHAPERRRWPKQIMTTNSDDYVEFVMDQIAPLRGISTGRFFGGVGLSSAGTQFAMVMGSSLYFVVNDTTRPRYEKMGSSCFSYSTSKKRVAVRKYYAVPAELIEDQEQLVELAQEAIRVASAAKQGPTKRSNRSRVKRAPV